MIHFWLPVAPPTSEVLEWDPDRDPSRYASGSGHSVIELYRRLAGAGDPVTFGSAVPSTTRLLVLYKPSIESPALHVRALSVLRGSRASYALIRGDATGRFPLPVAPVRDFVPIAALVTSEEHRWLPPLPQRGLLPRRLERRGRVRSLAFKGNPENVPPYMRDESWRAALADRGIHWHLDTPGLTDGSDQRWHDFSEVDAVACVRSPEMRWDIERKPATRLINAWRAGCIPLADEEPGYRELGNDGHDVFFVSDGGGCLAVLDRLLGDPMLVSRVETAMGRRAPEFAPEIVLAQWRAALLDALDAPNTGGWRARARTLRVAAAQARQLMRRR